MYNLIVDNGYIFHGVAVVKEQSSENKIDFDNKDQCIREIKSRFR